MKLRKLLVGMGLMAGMTAFALPTPAQAVNVFDPCRGNSASDVCQSRNDDASNIARNVINTMIFIIAIVAVIMIVIGGLRYVLSGGDSAGTTTAKNTILYAVIGLMVAILAFAIVNFAIDAVQGQVAEVSSGRSELTRIL